MGLWVMHPSLEVPTAVGEHGGQHDNSPRNLEGRGKSRTGNITSLAKVPRKCQNKMCWLIFGDEKSIPGGPEANPPHFPASISGGGISHLSVLFSTVDSTPRVTFQVPTPALGDQCLAALPQEGTALPPLSLGTYHLVPGRRVTGKEHSLTQCWVFTCAVEGPSQPTLDLFSIHAFRCY